ncbi:NAD(P)/FAD-dependent oxidoreductase [Sphingopyxis granuli]|uniref:FAD dependent oxidoreductase n=1 Tax=Sphingopyxis granuli TaxID=267128 RepID=A0AA86GJ29_9SPHN|nr:FAD-binding oxidoreductase [Sphingopyxis granuli]AMG73205.1 FAD dependent oxidoreductase [Sphingopyxis granuli]
MQHRSISRAARKDSVTSPLWTATAAPGPALAPLSGHVETDVLVVGGGIAGTATALHLAEKGVPVVLVEAGQPGDGATGQSGGLVAPDYIRHSPDSARQAFGAEDGERLNRMIGASGRFVFDLIARHAIDCDARPDGFYTPAHTEALADNQRRSADQWRSRGYAVDFVEGAEVRRLFGADRYCGALRFGDGGSLNPLAYVRGLARAAEREGARLFANSPVAALERTTDGWLCRTPGGTVRADRVVLAANGGNGALHPAMRRTTLPLHVFQFASAPLDDAQRRAILPEGGAFTDKVPYLFTARLDGQGHLVSAFPASFLIRSDAALYREARRRLAQHFAAMPDPQIDFLWRGLAWVNTSFLPEVYDLGEGAIAIQACNGRGIATNSVLGAEVAAMLATGDRTALSVQPRAPAPVRFHAGAAWLPKLLMSMAYLSN